MAGYDQIIGRADVSDALIPEQYVKDIIQTTPEDSVMLTRARRVTMSKNKTKQPVLASLPEAYWVDGDTGLKQTSDVTWKNIMMTAEELAVIVPIPDALVDDSDIPLWEAVKPLVKEALGKKVDQACFFGTDKPASWPEAIVPAAIAAGNVSQLSDTNKLDTAFLSIAQKAAEGGFAPNGFVTQPGLNWQLRGLKDNQGGYLFGAPTQGGNANLFGFDMDEVRNGAWNAAAATGLAVDWSKFVIGIRQDVTYDLFKEGVISDADGKVLLNLMQQDTKALRVVFRVGYQAAIPVTRLAGKYPAGVVTPKSV